jgi:hypothetical protein
MFNKHRNASVKFHCISCGGVWGEGEDIESYGLCIECFAKWAVTKKPCFGIDFVVENSTNCPLHKYCGEFYGFKQDLSRRF